MLRLAIRESFSLHAHDLEGAIIQGNRPSIAVFSLACSHPYLLADEVNLVPPEQPDFGVTHGSRKPQGDGGIERAGTALEAFFQKPRLLLMADGLAHIRP